MTKKTAAALFAAVLTIAAQAAYAETPDQASDCSGPSGALGIGSFAPMGQTFQPDQATVTAAELLVEGFNGDPPLGTLTVNLRDGGTVDGTILGTATVGGVSIPQDQTQWIRFDFVPDVTVTPGNTYMLEVSGNNLAFGLVHLECDYMLGAAVYTGDPGGPVADFQFRTFGPCGNGTLDPFEECDDGVLSDDACCLPHTCQFKGSGESCNSDGNNCTFEQCSGTATACTVSMGNASEGVECDDHSICTQIDACDAGGGHCIGTGTPAVDCGTALKASLGLTQSATAGKDKVKFKWTKGILDPEVLTPLALAFDDAALCVYTSGTPSVVLSSQLPAGTEYAIPFVPDKSAAIEYQDKEGTIAGVTKMNFKLNLVTPASSQLSWQAGGDNLTGLLMTAALTGPVTAQVITSSGGCWGAVFDADAIKKNDGAKFKGVAK